MIILRTSDFVYTFSQNFVTLLFFYLPPSVTVGRAKSDLRECMSHLQKSPKFSVGALKQISPTKSF